MCPEHIQMIAKGTISKKTSTNVVSKRVTSPHKIELRKGCFCTRAVFVLRFSRKAKLTQKVLRVDPTMVSLPLDARRTKWQWSFDRFACLTCSFAPARRLSRETHCRHRQRQKKRLRPTVKCAPARRPSFQMRFRAKWNSSQLEPPAGAPNQALCVKALIMLS